MAFPSHTIARKLLFGMFALLTASAVYLYGFPQQNVFYAVIVLLHLAAGIAASILLLPLFSRLLREGTWLSWAGWILFLGGAALGFWLVHTGTTRAEWKWMYAHMVVCAAALAFIYAEFAGRRVWVGSGSIAAPMRLVVCLLLLVGLG